MSINEILSIDIITQIISYTPDSSIKETRLVCKLWNDINKRIGNLLLRKSEKSLSRICKDDYDSFLVHSQPLVKEALFRGSKDAYFYYATHWKQSNSLKYFKDQTNINDYKTSVQGLIFLAYSKFDRSFAMTKKAKTFITLAIKKNKLTTLEILQRDSPFLLKSSYSLAWTYRFLEQLEDHFELVKVLTKHEHLQATYDLAFYWDKKCNYVEAAKFYVRVSTMKLFTPTEEEYARSSCLRLAEIYGYGLGEGENRVKVDTKKAQNYLRCISMSYINGSVKRYKKVQKVETELEEYWLNNNIEY